MKLCIYNICIFLNAENIKKERKKLITRESMNSWKRKENLTCGCKIDSFLFCLIKKEEEKYFQIKKLKE